MVYNTQNYWISGLCPSSGILNTRKHNVSEIGSVSVLRWGEGYSPSFRNVCAPPARIYTVDKLRVQWILFRPQLDSWRGAEFSGCVAAHSSTRGSCWLLRTVWRILRYIDSKYEIDSLGCFCKRGSQIYMCNTNCPRRLLDAQTQHKPSKAVSRDTRSM
jgi:hypothetical protein